MSVALLGSKQTIGIRKEFAEKNLILDEHGEWLSSWDFYSLLFAGLADSEKVMVIEAGNKYVAMHLDEAIELGLGRSDVYISPATYFQNRYKASFIDKIYAVAVDIDNVNPKLLNHIMSNTKHGTLPMPTAVTNSGSGIHFYYIFNQPLITYRNVRDAACRLYDALHVNFGKDFGMTQKHWIGQPYRIVGGLTKAGDVSTAYRTGELWTPEALAEECHSSWNITYIDKAAGATDKMKMFASALAEVQQVDVPDFTNFYATLDFIKANRTFREGSKEQLFSPKPGSQKWYEDTRRRVLSETVEGNRYSSLMALAVIAFKCGIKRTELERDFYMIADLWGKESWHTVFNKNNIPAALRCYSPDFARVKRTTLEEWLGWVFTGTCKRNGRTQQEHLEKIAIEKRAKALYKLEQYLKKYPEASKRRISTDTGMSRNTVAKYYDFAIAMIK